MPRVLAGEAAPRRRLPSCLRWRTRDSLELCRIPRSTQQLSKAKEAGQGRELAEKMGIGFDETSREHLARKRTGRSELDGGSYANAQQEREELQVALCLDSRKARSAPLAAGCGSERTGLAEYEAETLWCQ